MINKNSQYKKFCAYGFLKNLRFFDAFIILYLIERGVPFSQIGILYAAREMIGYLFEIPSGIIADTYGRKVSLIASFFGYILSFVLFYISESFWPFLLAFVIFGTSDAFRSGTHKGMIMDYLKLMDWEDQKINYYGHTRSWSQLGSALSSLGAGFIVFYSGSYQHIFLYSIVPYFLNLMLISTYPKDLNRSSVLKSAKNKMGLLKTFKNFFGVIRDRHILKLVISSALHSAYLRAVKDYIQPVLIHVSLLIPIMLSFQPEKKNGFVIGTIYFLIYLITSLASLLSPKIAARKNTNISNRTLFLGLISGILCGWFYVYELWIFSMIAFIGIYFIENVRKPILTGLVADKVPNNIVTSVISAQSSIRTVITSILALAFGFIAEKEGIGASFLIITGFLTIFIVIFTFLPTNKSDLAK